MVKFTQRNKVNDSNHHPNQTPRETRAKQWSEKQSNRNIASCKDQGMKKKNPFTVQYNLMQANKSIQEMGLPLYIDKVPFTSQIN